MNFLFDIIGNIGVICFLAAFLMLQREMLSGSDYLYLYLNLIGSVLLLISLWWSFNLAAFILESCWGVISLYGLIKRWRKDRLAS